MNRGHAGSTSSTWPPGCGMLGAGAGGGGDTYPRMLMVRQAMEDHGPVALVDLDDLPDGALIMPCGTIGAPVVGDREAAARQGGAAGCATASRRVRGEPVAALMAVEIGGSNGMEPVNFAAELGLPLLDADAMGRAFPEVPMVSMEIAGMPAGLLLMADERGNVAHVPADRRRRGASGWSAPPR